MAPQLTVTNGFDVRSLAPWMARAISSLPTPDSPSIRIGICEAAARWPRRMTRSIAGLWVTMSRKVSVPEAGALHAREFAFERAELQRVLDRHLQALGRSRLDDEIDGAGAHGADHRVDAAVGGLHDHRDRTVDLAELAEHRHAVEVGHDEIEDDEGDRLRPPALLRRSSAAWPPSTAIACVAEPLDGGREQPALDGIVVDDEDRCRHQREVASRCGTGGRDDRPPS